MGTGLYTSFLTKLLLIPITTLSSHILYRVVHMSDLASVVSIFASKKLAVNFIIINAKKR